MQQNDSSSLWIILVQYFHSPAARENTAAQLCNIHIAFSPIIYLLYSCPLWAISNILQLFLTLTVYCFYRPFVSNRLKMIDWVVRYIHSNNNSYTCRKWCHRKWCIEKAASNNFFVNKIKILLPKIRSLFPEKGKGSKNLCVLGYETAQLCRIFWSPDCGQVLAK